MRKKTYVVSLTSEDIDRIRCALHHYRYVIDACQYWGMKAQWSSAQIGYTVRKMEHIQIEMRNQT